MFSPDIVCSCGIDEGKLKTKVEVMPYFGCILIKVIEGT